MISYAKYDLNIAVLCYLVSFLRETHGTTVI